MNFSPFVQMAESYLPFKGFENLPFKTEDCLTVLRDQTAMNLTRLKSRPGCSKLTTL